MPVGVEAWRVEDDLTTVAHMRDRDERAVKTLLGAYWSTNGWREEPTTAPDELASAVDAGVMFANPVKMTHDELVVAVLDALSRVSADQVADSFLTSLSSRRLDHRSALGSYAVARHLPRHEFEADNDGRCAVCRLCPEPEIDRNVLNFERFKWGGVRRLDLRFVWHDLDRFAATDRPSASGHDREVLKALLGELAGAPPSTTAPKAAQTLLRAIKANKAERSVLLDILGVCSVLETPEHPGFAEHFIRADARPLPPQRFVDQAYPVCWWKAKYGINRQALDLFCLS